MLLCTHCDAPVREAACACPACGAQLKVCRRSHTSAAVALMGLALVGCKDGEPIDTGFPIQPDYGVADTGYIDGDDDGVMIVEGDCDDTDATIYPGAPDTPGDGVDSDCDGEDD